MNTNNQYHDTEGVVKDGILFHNVYSCLPGLVPSHEAKDLSVPIAFVALLHMCNEKVLLDIFESDTQR